LLGVNGVGKTTQAAKLAHRLKREGRQVLLAAADTFRAAAGEQLQVWADRVGVPCVTGTPGGDPAAVAFDAVEAAMARHADVVLVDTAGRLHTQKDLMDELRKVARVVGRRRPGAPHETLLVVDGTVGQNALQQGKAFAEAVPVTGLIVTKLDGTAKGGAVVALRSERSGSRSDFSRIEPFGCLSTKRKRRRGVPCGRLRDGGLDGCLHLRSLLRDKRRRRDRHH
jgi:fused signal recognition particle receptor